MTESRRREALTKADALFETQQQIAQNTFDQAKPGFSSSPRAAPPNRTTRLRSGCAAHDLPGSVAEFWLCGDGDVEISAPFHRSVEREKQEFRNPGLPAVIDATESERAAHDTSEITRQTGAELMRLNRSGIH